MQERRAAARNRTLIGGKIVFNSGRSAIDCTVRNLSDAGACLMVATPLGIPDDFYLIITESKGLQACKVSWRAHDRVGVSFKAEEAEHDDSASDRSADTPDLEKLAFLAALDQVQLGIVLLDHELRARFINRAFRTMFRLPDAKANSKPPFVALMYHGRDTRAYEIAVGQLDQYVADRVAKVKAGDSTPTNIRLANGEVLRFQCAALPGGGRMLTYTPVTDIVRHSDELETLRAALDRIRDGVTLLDPELNVQFMNRSAHRLWRLPEGECETGRNIADLISQARMRDPYGVAPEELDNFIARRIAQIRAGEPGPRDLAMGNGRILRAQCERLPSGGRMLTYCDVTDLVRNAKDMETLATIDAVTGVCNRRHFVTLADREWTRFERYHRPLSMLVVDVDHFKSVNDRFGHDVGDAALARIAQVLLADRRTTDVVARLGGDEFVLLLPETDLDQASIVAERLCAAVRSALVQAWDRNVGLTLSIGVASATASMPGVTALIKAADEALYEAKAKGRNRFAVARPKAPETDVAAE